MFQEREKQGIIPTSHIRTKLGMNMCFGEKPRIKKQKMGKTQTATLRANLSTGDHKDRKKKKRKVGSDLGSVTRGSFTKKGKGKNCDQGDGTKRPPKKYLPRERTPIQTLPRPRVGETHRDRAMHERKKLGERLPPANLGADEKTGKRQTNHAINHWESDPGSTTVEWGQGGENSRHHQIRRGKRGTSKPGPRTKNQDAPGGRYKRDGHV